MNCPNAFPAVCVGKSARARLRHLSCSLCEEQDEDDGSGRHDTLFVGWKQFAVGVGVPGGGTASPLLRRAHSKTSPSSKGTLYRDDSLPFEVVMITS